MEQKRILIIDDNDQIREIMKLTLEYEGYKILTAANGQDGLDLLGEPPRPGLILLDLMMPVMNGWEFIAEINKDQDLKKIPVLVVSAYLESEDLEKSPVDCCGFLEKPVDMQLLNQQIALHYREVP